MLFKSHKLNEEGFAEASYIGEQFDELLNAIWNVAEGVESRELSLVKTHLEQACFYSKKLLAQQERYQLKETKVEVTEQELSSGVRTVSVEVTNGME